ncbi:MAG: hypothetical protein GX995_03770 [Clostridiales bacterium]|nr:hypothetical protein [Clostridiales bacterium]
MRRLTIRRRKRYERKEKYTMIITLFIMAPLISIIFGGALAKKVIVPYISTIKSNASSSKNSLDIKAELDMLNMYNIEVREFENMEGAESFLKDLNSKGILGYVSKSNKYKVFTYITFDRNKVEKQLSKIKRNYETAQMRYIEIERKELNVENDSEETFEQVLNTVRLVNAAYKEELDMWMLEVSQSDYNKLKNSMKKNTLDIKKSMEKYPKNIGSDELNTLIATINVNLNNRNRIEQDFNPKDSKSIGDTYFEYMKSFFSYINYYKI